MNSNSIGILSWRLDLLVPSSGDANPGLGTQNYNSNTRIFNRHLKVTKEPPYNVVRDSTRANAPENVKILNDDKFAKGKKDFPVKVDYAIDERYFSSFRNGSWYLELTCAKDDEVINYMTNPTRLKPTPTACFKTSENKRKSPSAGGKKNNTDNDNDNTTLKYVLLNHAENNFSLQNIRIETILDDAKAVRDRLNRFLLCIYAPNNSERPYLITATKTFYLLSNSNQTEDLFETVFLSRMTEHMNNDSAFYGEVKTYLKQEFMDATGFKTLTDFQLSYFDELMFGNVGTNVNLNYQHVLLNDIKKISSEFYSITSAISRQKVRPFWEDNLIQLMSKAKSEEVLTPLGKPAILFRVSNSQIGHLALSVYLPKAEEPFGCYLITPNRCNKQDLVQYYQRSCQKYPILKNIKVIVKSFPECVSDKNKFGEMIKKNVISIKEFLSMSNSSVEECNVPGYRNPVKTIKSKLIVRRNRAISFMQNLPVPFLKRKNSNEKRKKTKESKNNELLTVPGLSISPSTSSYPLEADQFFDSETITVSPQSDFSTATVTPQFYDPITPGFAEQESFLLQSPSTQHNEVVYRPNYALSMHSSPQYDHYTLSDCPDSHQWRDSYGTVRTSPINDGSELRVDSATTRQTGSSSSSGVYSQCSDTNGQEFYYAEQNDSNVQQMRNCNLFCDTSYVVGSKCDCSFCHALNSNSNSDSGDTIVEETFTPPMINQYEVSNTVQTSNPMCNLSNWIDLGNDLSYQANNLMLREEELNDISDYVKTQNNKLV